LRVVKTRVFLFGLILLCGKTGFAQDKTVLHQSLIWYGLSVEKKLPKATSIGLKVERRDFISPARQHQLVIPDLYFTKKFNDHWEMDAGLWVFTIYQPGVAETPVNSKQYEWRPYFTVNYRHQAWKGLLQFALKSEYRGFNMPDAEDRFHDMLDTYAIRERFLLRYSYKLTPALSARAGEELHLNVAGNRGQGVFDQNRLMADMVYTFSFKESNDQLKLNAGYMHWYQPSGANHVFFSHHIITTGIGLVF